MDTNNTQNEKKTEIINYQPTQKEMKDILISKIKHYKNVDIKLKEVTNAVGVFYAITTYIKLDEISNGIFHSATLKTVSYNKRTVNIKCVFSDNENLIRDMEINRDSVFQCFRDIAPDTITNISLEKFNDQSDKPHVRIIASTIKGSSLIYVYKRLMDFVNVINEKYGNVITNKEISQTKSESIIQPVKNNTIITHNEIENNKEINKEIKKTEEVKKPEEVKKTEEVKKPVEIRKSIEIKSSFSLSEQVIKDLEYEEVRLQELLDNIRLLKQTQQKCLENKEEIISKPSTNITNISNTNINKIDVPVSTNTQTTFASKVKESLKK